MAVRIAGYVGTAGQYPGYNILHSSELTELGYEEPVSLDEANEYLRLLGIETQDSLVEAMIIAARSAFENSTGLSLVSKTVEIWFSNCEGMYRLPFGPLDPESFELFDEDEVEITSDDYKLIGSEYPLLKEPVQGFLHATYNAGMSSVPEAIKNAIKAQINYLWENRGSDAEVGLCLQMQMEAQRWNRYGFMS